MSRIGPYTLHSIETGRFRLDGGAMFGIIPKPLWERQYPSDEKNRIEMAMRCLLVEGEGRLILVDNGLGDKYNDKFREIYAVDHQTDTLDGSLQTAGFSREDVTDVILTHLHFDHCGGSTRRGPVSLEVAFPGARFHVQREHWQWAAEPNAREKASFLRENIEPLARSGQLNLVDGAQEIFPGVHLIVVNGHTRGQQLVKISGPEGVLVYVADLLPTAAHLPMPWIMAYDLFPLESLSEKAEFLKNAAQQGWTLFFEHDAQTVLCNVEESERGFHAVEKRPFEGLDR